MAGCREQFGKLGLRDCVRRAKSRKLARNLVPSDAAYRDQTVWLGWEDSNSEMSSQIIPLKRRKDFRESSRILALETIRI